MRLPDAIQKIKRYPDLPKDIFVLLLICLVAFGSFIAGQYAAQDKQGEMELRVVDNQSIFDAQTREIIQAKLPNNSSLASTNQGMFVGSISGKTYHLPWCSGAKRIRDKNKIWFANKEEAVARGYNPASNCKGI